MLFLPCGIPCASTLKSAGHTIGEAELGVRIPHAQHILLLNLMPEKAACELQIARMLAPVGEDRDIQIIPVKIPGQTYKTTPMAHMERFYLDLKPEEGHSDDLLIVTGAPLENIAYEAVRYWQELTCLWDWAAQGGVARTLNICWAAFAVLHHFERIPTHHLAAKRFGLYVQQAHDVPALRDMCPEFPMPISRHIELQSRDFVGHTRLEIVASHETCGPGVVIDNTRHMTHIIGHLEYEADRLQFEYERDLSRGKPIQKPYGYSPENFSWHTAGLAFYRNFIVGEY